MSGKQKSKKAVSKSGKPGNGFRKASLIKHYIIFILIILAGYSILVSPPGGDYILNPLNRGIAMISGSLLNLAGVVARFDGTQIFGGTSSVIIREGCNGVYVTLLFWASVLAFPASLRKKLWGILIGTVAIFLINLIRVISLFLLQSYNLDLFNSAHLYIWQFIIIILAALIWIMWYAKFAAKDISV